MHSAGCVHQAAPVSRPHPHQFGPAAVELHAVAPDELLQQICLDASELGGLCVLLVVLFVLLVVLFVLFVYSPSSTTV